MDDGAHIGGVQHHYMHGFCFDGGWAYRARSRADRLRWRRLDLGSDGDLGSLKEDPEGAGWCLRCCASVLGQRPVSLAVMRQYPASAGEPAHVAMVLRALLPSHDIDILQPMDQLAVEMMKRIAIVLESGGGVLARLQRKHALRSIPRCWVWIVGVETKHASLNETDNPALALLLVTRELGPPWCSGYGAKAIWTNESMTIRSVDGQVWTGMFDAVIGVLPK